jgi:hypothetical protein
MEQENRERHKMVSIHSWIQRNHFHAAQEFTFRPIVKKLKVSIRAGSWKRMTGLLVQSFLRSYIFPALDCHQVDESKIPEFRFRNQDLLPWRADPGNRRWLVPELFFIALHLVLSP